MIHGQQGTSTAPDRNVYLYFRGDKSHLSYGMSTHGPSTTFMDPLHRPQKHSRDGSTLTANVLTKLSMIHDNWYFDLAVDNRVVSDARLECHGHIK